MGIFALGVAGLFFRPLLPRFLAAGVLFLCPAWLIRDVHFALSAHWVYLAGLWLYLKPGPAVGVARASFGWWVLLAVAALIHPYPTVFTFGFLVADQARRWWVRHEISPRAALFNVGVGAVVIVVLWYLAGFLRIGELPAGTLPEDRLWSASLHALWDSQGRGSMLPALPLGSRDTFEGFVYLGAGGLLAVVAAGVHGGGVNLLARLVRHWPLVAVLLVWAGYALGPRTDLGDQLFRAQARFLWPHFYVLVAAGIAAVARLGRPRWSLVLVGVIFLVQVVDLAPLFDRKSLYDSLGFTSRLENPQWEKAMAQADFLLTLPASTKNTVFKSDFVDLALLAHQARVPTTAGFATRNYLGNIKGAEELARNFLYGGNPETRTVGVLRREHFAQVFPDIAADLRCTDLDGFPVCFARDGGFVPVREYRATAVDLAGFLAANLDMTIIMVGKGDSRSALTAEAVELLAARGSNIARVPVGASYAGILAHGELVFERMQPHNAIEVTGNRNMALGPVRIVRELNITSGGIGNIEYASLKVDGREVMFNRPGLNVAVLDDRQEILGVATFGDLGSVSGFASLGGGVVFTLERVE